jgi:GH43 family beta-xylosidase
MGLIRTPRGRNRVSRRLLLGLAVAAALPAAAVRAGTITNPIVPQGADPWVTQWQGQYFYCRSAGGQIYVDRATRLQDIGSGIRQSVFTPPSGQAYSRDLWAPELHYLNDHWYIYFAADDGNNANHRMYVLESTSRDPQGTYTF